MAYEKEFSRVMQRRTLAIPAESTGTHNDTTSLWVRPCFDELMDHDMKVG